MSTEFDFKKIEEKWKKLWYKDNIYAAKNFSKKPKKYILVEFPYPSGKSMHVGHMMRYTVPEIYSRFLRMKGYNVLFPMGWDAFGLPAENFAIKTGTHPSVKTAELAELYKKSMQEMGYGIDWSREINTTNPSYYKWTQWIFLRFFEAGLVEFKKTFVWWSEKMKTVLAEEEVIKDENGNLVAERDGSSVIRKAVNQWVLKIPKYADKLIEGLDQTEFPESIKLAQRNWIGRSEGAEIYFEVNNGEKFTVFTTRPDTLWGATCIILSPEHELTKKIVVGDFKISDEIIRKVKDYAKRASQKTELERIEQIKDKTGVFSGLYAVNPATKKEIPVWISDFVLSSYGTGAIMSVPAHDERDFDFAKKFDIPIIPVIKPADNWDFEAGAYTDIEKGEIINSGLINGMSPKKAFQKVIKWLEDNSLGKKTNSYHLRDWVFSRQRYWGEPIPLIHKENGSIEAIVSIKDKDEINKKLPLELPDVPDYSPISDEISPLSRNKEWVNTKAKDGTPAKRETNTMPNWAGSCWYYLRYIDPNNDEIFADFEKMKYWLPVDHYFGGSEHTTLHLLYSRFWHKFLYDQKLVPTPEPYKKRTNGGILLAEDGTKMSKSKGNVIEPQEKMRTYGADAVRLYIAFLGPYNGNFPYSESSLGACKKLVTSIYNMRNKVSKDYQDDNLKKKLHQGIKKIEKMAQDLKMNTSISQIMILAKVFRESGKIPFDVWCDFLKIIAPFAVFTAEDLWQEANGFDEWNKENSIHLQVWPKYDAKLVKENVIMVGIQINGKIKATMEIDIDASEKEVKERALALDKVQRQIGDKEIKKFIYIPGKIINFVV